LAARGPIGAACHAPQLFAAADMVRDRSVSAYFACAPEVKLTGGRSAGISMDDAIANGNFVTGPAWPAHPPWPAKFWGKTGENVPRGVIGRLVPSQFSH
jgi:protease I